MSYTVLKNKVKREKRVWIEPGCVSCGFCQTYCPTIFEVVRVARVCEDADLETHLEKIQKAAEGCPVGVIKYIE